MSESPPASKKHCLEVSGEMSNNHSTSGTSSGTVVLPNSNLQKFDDDFLYHLGYSKSECDERFSDVKFVVTGGSSNRLEGFAKLLSERLDLECKIMSRTDRFAFFKVGPVICVNHGMGVPSITILLHEIIKLLKYSGAVDPIILRLGTSGGIGVDPGTVVVTNKSFNAFLEEKHEVVVLGRRDFRDAVMDQSLVEELYSHRREIDGFRTVLGGTLCTDDFYEGQARMDGVSCIHGEEDKMDYLKRLKEKGICNIEMECTALSSICHATNIKCGVVCVALLDRFLGDQVTVSPEDYQDYVQRPQELICRFIKARLNGSSQ